MQANVSSERISSWCLLSSLVSSRSRCSDRWHVKVIHPKYFKHLKEADWLVHQEKPEILNIIAINLHFYPAYQFRMYLQPKNLKSEKITLDLIFDNTHHLTQK